MHMYMPQAISLKYRVMEYSRRQVLCALIVKTKITFAIDFAYTKVCTLISRAVTFLLQDGVLKHDIGVTDHLTLH